MRRYVIGIFAMAVVAAGGYAAFAGIQRMKACPPVAQPSPQSARGATAGNFDPAMSGVCRFACATKLKYEAADVAAQPGAQSGKLTQCPVSGVVFVVDTSRPHVMVADKDFVTCCGNCAEKLRHDPGHYLKA